MNEIIFRCSNSVSIVLMESFFFKVDGCSTIDAVEAGILDLYLGKYWGLKYATEAACTVLQVDQIILAKRAGGPKPQQNAAADDD